MTKLAFAALLGILAALAGAPALGADPDFTSMLKAVDRMGNFGSQDYSATYTMVSQKPGEKDSVMQVKLFRRDAQNQFVWLMLKPDAQKGQGFLRVGDNVWMFDPESGKFNHSTMSDTIQNSEARNSDLGRYSYTEDYTIQAWEEITLGRYPAFVLTLKAKTEEVSYPKLKLTIRKDKPVMLREEDFSLSDRLLRTILYPPRYIEISGRTVPSQILIQDELNRGNKTQLTIGDLSVAHLADSTFSKAFLEQASH
jgi:outer membrane lipoprotein-sorting protein